MPIRNSKVASSEVFSVQRKKRLARGRGQAASATDHPSDPPGQASAGVLKDKLDAHDPNQSTVDEPGVASSEQGEPSDTEVGTEAPETRQGPATRPRLARRQDRPAETISDMVDPDDQLRLQVKLPYPASGTSATFDQLADVQGEKGAFRLVLTKALELYAASVADGTFADAPTKYSESQEIARTTRKFPRTAYVVLEKELNRTGLLSDRAVGTAIARRALAAFIASDKELI